MNTHEHAAARRLFGGFNAAPTAGGTPPMIDPAAFERWAEQHGYSNAPPEIYRRIRDAFEGGAEWAAKRIAEELEK